ncbi:hypothetical protein, partial [Sodalis sp. (in: enterobacteria)]|uniref:hypothetical protein n=1 Tax=Sodalis sp. (in: enterobacteria) TaxID=1898979 RepID=UPI003F686112
MAIFRLNDLYRVSKGLQILLAATTSICSLRSPCAGQLTPDVNAAGVAIGQQWLQCLFGILLSQSP